MANIASATVTVTNKLGLHARPAMVFVEAANRFQSTVLVQRADGGQDAESVDGKSIMHMMMLAATSGTDLTIEAQGTDADDAVATLVCLVKSNFGEE